MKHYINYHRKLSPHKFMLLENDIDDNIKKINEFFYKFNPKETIKKITSF